jgi:hypothetical protein
MTMAGDARFLQDPADNPTEQRHSRVPPLTSSVADLFTTESGQVAVFLGSAPGARLSRKCVKVTGLGTSSRPFRWR